MACNHPACLTRKCRSHRIESNTEARNMPGRRPIPAGRRRTQEQRQVPAREHPPEGGDPGEYAAGFGQRGDGHGARRAGLPGRRGRHRDGGRDPGPVPADAGAGQLDGHRGAGLDPGRVHRRAGLLRGRGLQPAGLADQPDPRHQGRRGRPTPRGSGGPRRIRWSRGRWRPGRYRSRSPGRSALDRQAARRTAARTRTRSCWGRRRPARTCGTWPGWPPRSTPGPCPRTRARSRIRRSRTGRSGWRPRSTARGCCPGT